MSRQLTQAAFVRLFSIMHKNNYYWEYSLPLMGWVVMKRISDTTSLKWYGPFYTPLDIGLAANIHDLPFPGKL